METKAFVNIDNLEIKSGESGNTIVGYGSTWGNADLVGDIIEKDAFSKSLASGKKIKMLWMHDWKEPIGVWTSITQDEKGLRVEGRFSDTNKAREVRNLVKDGAIDGLSVSFRINDHEWKDNNRIIKAATLSEISIVSIPCNEEALITEVKSADEMNEREFEKSMRDAYGFSRKKAKILAGVFAKMNGLRDADHNNTEEEIEDTITDEIVTIDTVEEVKEDVIAEVDKSGISAEEYAEIKSLLNSIRSKITN